MMYEVIIHMREIMTDTLEIDENDFPSVALPWKETHKTNEIETACARYAGDTWNGLKRLAATPTGYPQDMITVENGKEVANPITSPTNIGLYLASIIAARDMNFVSAQESNSTISSILNSLEGAEKYEGLFYNWYDTQAGGVYEEGGERFISTVDNAWLAVGLMAIRASTPQFSDRVGSLLNEMNFSLLYDKNKNLFHGGFYPITKEPTTWFYDILNTEARIASYVGMDMYNIPRVHFERLRKDRTSGQGTGERPSGEIFSSWGGSMFEALMPTLFIPEQEWSDTLASSHKRYVESQMQYGRENNKGFWGYSPSSTPSGNYQEVGIGALALKEGGYGASSVVTPHALFLSLPFSRDNAFSSLQRLERRFPSIYKEGYGFTDSINVQTGEAADVILSVDQGMSFLSLFNFLNKNKMHRYLSPQFETIKPIIKSLDHEMAVAA